MKLQKELNALTVQYKAMSAHVAAYAATLKSKGGYNDFETRLAMDILRETVGSDIICKWYDYYDCNDAHILTLAKAALKQVYDCNLHKKS